ncbi:uncharacterized protein CEXT_589261 [Caerostris extrusa]|uniref:Cuticle protein 16.8 n=1 Tax=Caerostris extrusa TaxID=172846 RepID=A0AAV4R1W1_CAEEX|nr:uncharacterized protein CEXT_589261 [Caerostris extrusa]
MVMEITDMVMEIMDMVMEIMDMVMEIMDMDMVPAEMVLAMVDMETLAMVGMETLAMDVLWDIMEDMEELSTLAPHHPSIYPAIEDNQTAGETLRYLFSILLKKFHLRRRIIAGNCKMFALVILSCIVLVASNGIHQPQPYKFGYSIKDHHGEQHREESGNGAGSVVGNYGFTDDRGIARQVNYVADHAGFRAQVKTNEPGTANQNPAALSADPVLGLIGGYGYGRNGYGSGRNGYGYGSGSYGLGYGGNGNLNYGRPLGYNGGYGGVVNFGAPLIGGAIRGYDSRFVNVA